MKTNTTLRCWLFLVMALMQFSIARAQNDLPPPSANVETIPAGAFIIPMDNTLQGTAGVMNLKAYGLVNQLLWNNVRVKWAIKTSKGKDSTDFKVVAYKHFPTYDTSRLIAGANFETTTLTPNWTYTNVSGGTNTTASKYNDGKSWRMGKNMSITMDNISLADYTNVQLSVAFASVGPDATEDLYLDLSYDNGTTWNGTGSVTLVSGDGSSLNINNTASNTVSPNPYIVNIPSTATQVRARLRTSNAGNFSSEYYYVDDIKLTGTYNRPFIAGPIIIMPTDTAAARTVINNYNATTAAAAKVNVYRASTSFSADIRYTLSHKPKIAVYDDGGNANIHTDLLDEAGITSTYYSVLSSGTIVDSVNCYTFASTPHWGVSSYSSADSARLLSLKSFLRSGGNFLAQCEGIDAIENFPPDRYLTTNGVNTLNAGITTIQWMNTDMPVMQFDGGLSAPAGSIKNWNITSGSWVSPRYKGIYFMNGSDTANILNVTKMNDASDIGGNMVYLAGHNYSGSGATDKNGMRVYLNAVLMPAKDLQVDVTATSNTPVCPGDTIKLYGNIYGGFSFSWTGPNGFTSTQQYPKIANANSTKAGTYTLTMNVPPGGGGCAYTYTTTTVVVTKPSLTTTASQTTICQGDSTTLSFSPTTGISTAHWYKNTGSTCTPNGQFMGTGLTLNVAPDTTTKYTAIGITSSGGCADTATNCITVIVDRRPVISSATSTTLGACYGKGVTATITAGSGGSGCSETWQWRQDAGSWQAYTSGTLVGTTAHDSIEIRVTRSCSSGCNITVRSRWIVKAQIVTTSNYTLANCGVAAGYVAQLNATNPSPSTGLWTITSGSGTIMSPTSYQASVAGLSTTGGTTTIKWVVTNDIGCKDSSSVSITPVALDTSQISTYSTTTCLTCPVKNGDSYYFYDLNGRILGIVNDLNDASELGSTSFCANLDYNPSGTPTTSDVEHEPATNMPYLPRSWNIDAEGNASYQMTVYITDEELAALIGAASGTQYSFPDISQLYITSYPSGSTPAAPGSSGGTFITPIYQRVGDGWTLTFPATGDRTFYVHPITYPWATLPVELTSFTATPMETFIRLDWTTASELNNDHFDIERSTDGTSFEIIGRVDGSGTVHAVRRYSFDDRNADYNKLYYYRLKQVDYDSKSKSSKIVTASLSKASVLTVSEPMPNPTQGYTFIKINSSDSKEVKVSILSMDGSLVTESQLPLNDGMNQISLNVSELGAGTYICRFETQNGIIIKKLVKAQ